MSDREREKKGKPRIVQNVETYLNSLVTDNLDP